MFEGAEAYEVMMGRWSRRLAPLFVEFAVSAMVTACSTWGAALGPSRRRSRA